MSESEYTEYLAAVDALAGDDVAPAKTYPADFSAETLATQNLTADMEREGLL